jgi:hypothetical protein
MLAHMAVALHAKLQAERALFLAGPLRKWRLLPGKLAALLAPVVPPLRLQKLARLLHQRSYAVGLSFVGVGLVPGILTG